MTFGKRGLTDYGSPPATPMSEAGVEREQRVHRLMKVTLFHERFGSADGVIRDISSGGLGGRCNATLEPGDIIEIQRQGFGRFEAEVRWVRNGHFGAQLTSDLRIDTKTVETLAFNGKNWDRDVNKPLENHVFTRFRPVQKAYRPGIGILRRDP